MPSGFSSRPVFWVGRMANTRSPVLDLPLVSSFARRMLRLCLSLSGLRQRPGRGILQFGVCLLLLTSTLGTSHENNLGLRKLTCTDWLRLAANHAIVIIIVIRLLRVNMLKRVHHYTRDNILKHNTHQKYVRAKKKPHPRAARARVNCVDLIPVVLHSSTFVCTRVGLTPTLSIRVLLGSKEVYHKLATTRVATEQLNRQTEATAHFISFPDNDKQKNASYSKSAATSPRYPGTVLVLVLMITIPNEKVVCLDVWITSRFMPALFEDISN